MRDGPRRFRQDSSCPALLRIPLVNSRLAGTGLSPSPVYLSRYFLFVAVSLVVVLQPRPCRNKTGLGSSHFARHYSGNRSFFLFLRVLRCFSSPGSPTLRCSRSSTWRVPPFGYPRINSCLQIPAAFRSLPRPSSPIEAKASTVRSLFLRLDESCSRIK